MYGIHFMAVFSPFNQDIGTVAILSLTSVKTLIALIVASDQCFLSNSFRRLYADPAGLRVAGPV